jgi:hypothetical protein
MIRGWMGILLPAIVVLGSAAFFYHDIVRFCRAQVPWLKKPKPSVPVAEAPKEPE